MNWPFRRSPPVLEDPQIPLEVTELEPADMQKGEEMAELVNSRWLEHDFGEKPADLVRAAEGEFTRPRPVVVQHHAVAELTQPITVPWRSTPPTVPGLYWWSDRGSAYATQCVVLDYGGRLCIRIRRGDSSKFVAVDMLNREWSGPLPLGEGMTLEDLW